MDRDPPQASRRAVALASSRSPMAARFASDDGNGRARHPLRGPWRGIASVRRRSRGVADDDSRQFHRPTGVAAAPNGSVCVVSHGYRSTRIVKPLPTTRTAATGACRASDRPE